MLSNYPIVYWVLSRTFPVLISSRVRLLILILTKLCKDALSRLWVKECDGKTLCTLTWSLVDKADAVSLSVCKLLLDVLASESHVVDTYTLLLDVLSDSRLR